jgi:hypothetical protein
MLMLLRPAAALPQLSTQLAQCFATASKSAPKQKAADPSKPAQSIIVTKTDWKAIKLPEEVVDSIPTTNSFGQAFGGDLRSTSGLGMGDGITNHTDKWLQVGSSL